MEDLIQNLIEVADLKDPDYRFRYIKNPYYIEICTIVGERRFMTNLLIGPDMYLSVVKRYSGTSYMSVQPANPTLHNIKVIINSEIPENIMVFFNRNSKVCIPDSYAVVELVRTKKSGNA